MITQLMKLHLAFCVDLNQAPPELENQIWDSYAFSKYSEKLTIFSPSWYSRLNMSMTFSDKKIILDGGNSSRNKIGKKVTISLEHFEMEITRVIIGATFVLWLLLMSLIGYC